MQRGKFTPDCSICYFPFSPALAGVLSSSDLHRQSIRASADENVWEGGHEEGSSSCVHGHHVLIGVM